MREKSDIGFPIDGPAYLRVRDGVPTITRELLFGKLVGDFDEHDRLIGVQILGPCFVTLGVADHTEPLAVVATEPSHLHDDRYRDEF